MNGDAARAVAHIVGLAGDGTTQPARCAKAAAADGRIFRARGRVDALAGGSHLPGEGS